MSAVFGYLLAVCLHVYIGMFSMSECVYGSERTELNCMIELSVVRYVLMFNVFDHCCDQLCCVVNSHGYCTRLWNV